MAKSLKKIFAGIFLIWLALVSLAAAFYWPQMKQSASTLMGHQFFGGASTRNVSQAVAAKSKQEPGASVPAPAPAPAAVPSAGSPREGFLWVDLFSSQYLVTLGKVHGAAPGKTLIVYEGSSELGEVTVEKALETVSYVRPAPGSLDLSGNSHGYYRVVME